MTIRQEHKQFTRSRILDAAAAELGRNSVEELTVNCVARTAGITERTLYRHFPTRDDLLGAVWAHIQGRIGSQGFPSTADELCKWPAHLFAAFDNHSELV